MSERTVCPPSDDGGHETRTADVAVMGAGLIGMLTALSLAKRGLTVLLVDDIVNQKRSFKVGESFLVSTALPRTIGELDTFLSEECFVKLGVWFTQGATGTDSFGPGPEFSIAPLSEHTVRTTLDARDHYLYQAADDAAWFRCLTVDEQICRPDTEEVLRGTVRAHPRITFVDAARVRHVELGASDDAPHVIGWNDAGSEASAQVRWVVDCSGRSRVLAKKFGHVADRAELADGFQTTSVWAQFGGITDELFGPEWEYHADSEHSTRRDHYTLHLWGEGYWIWVIRLSKDRISVGVIYDQRRPRPGKTPREQLFQTIALHPLLAAVLSPERLLEFRMYRNVQYFSDTVAHPRRYAMLGDAESIIDAYYSQGIGLSCQHLWHVTNIIHRDVHDGVLDRAYIDRLNRCCVLDWRILREMFREKYTPAIEDPRFFLLSHLVDLVVLWSTGTARADFATWLTRTQGDPAREDAAQRRLRASLEKHLFYSGARIWGPVSPERVLKITTRLQRGLAARARWRVEHGERVPATHCQISLARPLPRLWRTLGARTPGQAGEPLDVSPLDYIVPRALRRKGRAPLLARLPISVNRKLSIVLKIRTQAVIAALLAAYAHDVIDTAWRRARHRLRRTRPVSVPLTTAPARPVTDDIDRRHSDTAA